MKDEGQPDQTPHMTASPQPAASVRFEEIYEAHFDYVWNTLRRMGVAERHLEDVAHDVFVVVYRKLADFDATRPVKPWLFGIAYRVSADHRKKRSNQEILEEEPEVSTESPAEIVEKRSDARKLVVSALSGLDEDKRATFVLSEIEELTAPQVSEILNIPVNTVYSRLKVARELFLKALHKLKKQGAEL